MEPDDLEDLDAISAEQARKRRGVPSWLARLIAYSTAPAFMVVGLAVGCYAVIARRER